MREADRNTSLLSRWGEQRLFTVRPIRLSVVLFLRGCELSPAIDQPPLGVITPRRAVHASFHDLGGPLGDVTRYPDFDKVVPKSGGQTLSARMTRTRRWDHGDRETRKSPRRCTRARDAPGLAHQPMHLLVLLHEPITLECVLDLVHRKVTSSGCRSKESQ